MDSVEIGIKFFFYLFFQVLRDFLLKGHSVYSLNIYLWVKQSFIVPMVLIGKILKGPIGSYEVTTYRGQQNSLSMISSCHRACCWFR